VWGSSSGFGVWDLGFRGKGFTTMGAGKPRAAAAAAAGPGPLLYTIV